MKKSDIRVFMMMMVIMGTAKFVKVKGESRKDEWTMRIIEGPSSSFIACVGLSARVNEAKPDCDHVRSSKELLTELELRSDSF